MVLCATLINPLFFPAGGDSSQIGEPPCWLQCKLLTTKDYIDLLWTTASEFPGKQTTASEFPGKQTTASEFPGKQTTASEPR